MSLIHYKFRAAKDFSSITFEGLSLSLFELKKEILLAKKLKGTDFDIVISNAQTNEGNLSSVLIHLNIIRLYQTLNPIIIFKSLTSYLSNNSLYKPIWFNIIVYNLLINTNCYSTAKLLILLVYIILLIYIIVFIINQLQYLIFDSTYFNFCLTVY
jgi:hypothetical protein